MKNNLKFSLVIAVIALISACSSASLLSSWAKEGYTPQVYKKILVLAIASQVSNRATVEKAFADEFKRNKIESASSIYVFPASQNVTPDQLKAIGKEELAQKFTEHGIDGFLILSLLDKKEEQVYVEGSTYTTPSTVYHPGYYNQYYPYYNNYYNYYSTVYSTVSTPGYYKNQTSFFLESNFYNVGDQSLVWSAQSKSVDPAGISEGAADWAYAVVKEMKAKKIFAQ
jgi:hypothetical protein